MTRGGEREERDPRVDEEIGQELGSEQVEQSWRLWRVFLSVLEMSLSSNQ